MTTVSYSHEFPYTEFSARSSFPTLAIRVARPDNPMLAVDVDGYLDSGAQRSLFDGTILLALNLDLLSGERVSFSPTRGPRFEARLHQVQLFHADLGSFEIDAGFSVEPIARNLLGRDFFNMIQIGFREHQLTFFVTPTP